LSLFNRVKLAYGRRIPVQYLRIVLHSFHSSPSALQAGSNSTAITNYVYYARLLANAHNVYSLHGLVPLSDALHSLRPVQQHNGTPLSPCFDHTSLTTRSRLLPPPHPFAIDGAENCSILLILRFCSLRNVLARSVTYAHGHVLLRYRSYRNCHACACLLDPQSL
jgi:hypothetical protein